MERACGGPPASGSVGDVRRRDDAAQVPRKPPMKGARLPVTVRPRRGGWWGRGWGPRRGQGVDRSRGRGRRAWHPRVAKTPQQVGVSVSRNYPTTRGAACPGQRCQVARVRRQFIRIVRGMVPDDADSAGRTGGNAVDEDLRAAGAADPDDIVQGRCSHTPRHGAGSFPRPMSPDLPTRNSALHIGRAMSIKLCDMHGDQRRNCVSTRREQSGQCVIRSGVTAGVQRDKC